MNENVFHDIDDTDQIRPHMRLCHLILREGLENEIAEVASTPESTGALAARSKMGDSWKSFMEFTPPQYSTLVDYFKQMAEVSPELFDAEGNILVRLAGRDATIRLRIRRDEGGRDELSLQFPTAVASETAT